MHGQQTIFNVPTTDVLDKGKVYAELDTSLKPTDGFWALMILLSSSVIRSCEMILMRSAFSFMP